MVAAVTFLITGIHWMVMTTWVMLQNTDFCPSTVQERFFNAIVGVIYCFSYFNLKEGRSRYRIATFYTIMCLENAALLMTWQFMRDGKSWFDETLMLALPIGLTVAGGWSKLQQLITFQVLYTYLREQI